ncbi:MAG TPA: TolC family protein [Chitinophagaceae bacterium]|nr:TolC family protein [Chitinophagaceae bacterium]
MVRKKVCSVIIISFLLTGVVKAQDTTSSPGIKWTLQQCIDYAKLHNIQINNLRLTAQSAEQDLLQSKAARQPDLNGSFNHSFTHGKVLDTNGVSFKGHTGIVENYSVNSGVTLYNGDYINNDIKQKGLIIQSSNLDVIQTENDITLQITQAFLNILLAKENIVYLQDLVNTSQAQLQQEQTLYNAGSVARKDFVSFQAQAATDAYNLVLSQNTLRQNTLTLKQLLQLPVDTAFEANVPDSLTAERMYPALDQAVNSALQNRPEIKNGQLQVDIAHLDLEKARAGLRPSITASGSLSTGYTNGSGAYFRQLDNNFFQQVGLTLSVPIFNKRVTRTAIEKSKIGITQSENDLENTKTVLSQAVEQAYINVQNAESQYDASVVALTSARESYQITNEEMKLGAINAVDLLVEKNLYTQALESYIQAKYNTVLYIKIYEFYMGMPVTL